MYGYIYKVINITNDKIYIGKHKGEFDCNYKGSSNHIKAAIAEQGEDNFIVELIEYCDSIEEHNSRERYWIEFFRNQGHSMYNVGRGGEGGDTFYNITHEARERRIENLRKNSYFNNMPTEKRLKGVANRKAAGKYVMSENQKSKLKQALHNYCQSDRFAVQLEIRRQRSAARRDRFLQNWLSEQHRCKRCNKIMTSYYGSGIYCCKSCAVTHEHTQETKDKLAEMCKQGICGNKGKHFTDEHKRKIGEANKGKVRTEEYKKKLSESRKGKPAWNKGLDISDPRVRKYGQARRGCKGPTSGKIGVTRGSEYR